jgi:hypothetical protein
MQEIQQFLNLPEEEREAITQLHKHQQLIRSCWVQIKREEKELINRKTELQLECKHPFATKTAKADTGNWCKADDSYWYEFKCPDCGKFWQEDQ